MSWSGSPPSINNLCNWSFLLGLLAAISFVLWVPVFPSGDGPVHLYYADILSSLVRHQPQYAEDYAVRHLLAPYLVHYLALFVFEHIVAPPLAEKLFIAVIFLTTASGFRFLARALGPQVGLACLWMLPLLFSWSLGGGFLNCCFATGVALWSFGIWTLLGTQPPPPSHRPGLLLAAFAGLLAVLVLSHPVPLLVLLLFTASDLSLRIATRWLRRSVDWPALVPQASALVLACSAFVAPVLLAEKGQAAAVLPDVGFHGDVLAELAGGMRLGYFAGLNIHSASGWFAIAARVLLVGIVPGVGLLFALAKRKEMQADPSGADAQLHQLSRQPQRRRVALETVPRTPAGRLLLISLVYLASTVFFPRSLNHSFFFPQRMWDIVWLLVLACGAAAPLSAHMQRWLAGVGLTALALTAVTGLPALAHIAREQQLLSAASLPPVARGLLLEPASAIDGRGAATTYPVHFWAGARAFAASRAILLNSPWLELTILPLKDASGPARQQALLDRGLPSIYSENPVSLTNALASIRNDHRQANQDRDRATILERADFVLYVDPASPVYQPHPDATERDRTRAAALALLHGDSAAWQCDAPSFYAVCVRAR